MARAQEHQQPGRARVAFVGLAVALALATVLGLKSAQDARAATDLVVNSMSDAVDAKVGDGVCATREGTCTLRAAIQETNALTGPDTIRVPAGIYALAIAPLNENAANNGDYDVTSPLTVIGEGAGSTILDSGAPPDGSPAEVRGLDRLFELHATAGNVSISGLTIREGYSLESGGGIHHASSGTLRLENVSVLDSYAKKYGGAINNAGGGRVELVGSALSGNGAVQGGSAINNAAAGSVAILAGSTVSENPGPMIPDPLVLGQLIPADPATYPLGAGALHNQAESDAIGTITIADSTVFGNFASNDGAAIHNSRDGRIVVERSTITGNATEGRGGGIYTTSGTVRVTESRILDNQGRRGGGIYNNGLPAKAGLPSRIDVTNSTVANNTALEYGGGIFNDLDGELVLTDADVSANDAGADGGGISSLHKASLVIIRGTVSGNVADGLGGGVHTDTERPVTIDGVLFSENAALEGGALSTGGLGTVNVAGSTFSANTAAADGGGVAIHSKGPVMIEHSTVRDNAAAGRGGGVQNSGMQVTLTRLTIDGNTAIGNGGGINNTSSGEFIVLGSSIAANTGDNGGGFANAPDATAVIAGSTLRDNRARRSGGAFHNLSDADSLIENTTLSGNAALVSGGGIYSDADASLHVANVTIWRNSAPLGGGISTVESDFVPPVPPTANPSFIVRNTIVGGSCDAMLTSEGGNIDSGFGCLFQGPRDRSSTDPALDAIADNGGPSLTHALRAGSLAVDGGVEPCPATDQRGVTRPQNIGCDIGAYEFVGVPHPPDEVAPETTITGASRAPNGTPIFSFNGSDDMTGESELLFECRILKLDPAQPDDPSPLTPFAPCSSPHAVLEVEHGENTFEVRAADRAGNVDPTPARHAFMDSADTRGPETTITAQPPDPSNADAVIFSFAGSDDLTPLLLIVFECRLDSQDPAAFTDCRSPHSYADRDLEPGEHHFEVRAIDLAGNVDSSPASHSWTVTAPPDTTIDSGPETTTTRTTAEFTFSADQSGSTFRCSLDGAPFEACSSPLEYTGLTVGDHQLDVQATNTFGLTDETPASYDWAVLPPPVDTMPPDTVIGSGPDTRTTSTDATLVFSADETGTSFECALDSETFTACLSPAEYTALALGRHEFRVRAIDPSGNVDVTPARHEWTVEEPAGTTAPETTIASGPDATTTSTAATFVFSADEQGSSFECALDSETFTACLSPAEYTVLALGGHQFRVRAIDAAGNVDLTPASYTWTVSLPVDCGAPRSAVADADSWIDQNSASTNKGADSVLKVRSKGLSDNFRALVRFRLPTGVPEGCAVQSATLRLYADSATAGRILHAQRVAAGWSESLVTWSNQPQTAGTPAATTSGLGYREWNVTSHVQAMYDAGSSHGFLIRDAVEGGDAEQSFYSREKGQNPPMLVVRFAAGPPPDTTAPDTAITEQPANPSGAGPASFSFAGSDDATPSLKLAFECRLDGGIFAACASPKVYTELSAGSHTFAVRAIDLAGNVDSTPASYTWTVTGPVDCGAPRTVLADADSWIDQNSPFTGKGTDSVLKVRSKGTSDNYRALVRFPLPTGVPEGCALQSATLRLYADSAVPGRNLHAFRVAAGWSENLVAWSNQPQTTGTPAATASGLGYREWDVTSHVQAMYDAGSNHGFLIRDAAEGGDAEQSFHSREKGGNPPTLVVRLSPVGG